MNSYYGAIIADVYWISDLPVTEALQLSSGMLRIEQLGSRTGDRVDELRGSLTNKLPYAKHFESMHEAIQCYDNGYMKAFNLLLLTAIEGLVRQLGSFLIEKQSLDVDPHSQEYNSLDAFLRKIPWKTDIPIRLGQLSLLQITRLSFDANKSPMDRELISLKTRLDFLRRRFKENRDIILHGQEAEYNRAHYGYVNASAAMEVIHTIRACHGVYS
jgi:hypothetical protein